MHRRIERLVSGHSKKLALAAQPFNYLLQNTNRQLQVDSKYVDLQVGKQVWYNVPRRMRQELWLSVLHKHRGAGATAAKQFATFVKQTLPVDVDADIEKDVGRTFPSSARFATAAGKLSLQRVLRAYAVYDTEVGYCQGMNFLAGLLLTYMPNEACAFGGLVVLMQERNLRELYKTDLARLQVYLWQFGALLPAKLAKHMEEQGTLPVLYVSSWLLTSFGSDFPLFFSSRVLDVALTGSYPHAMIKVALALLQKCEKQLLLMADMEEIVHFLKAEVPCWSREELQDVLSDALSLPWTAEQEAVLGNELGMETVVDAVGRINGFVKSGSTTPTKTPVDSSTLASITESPSTTATLTAAAAAAQTLNTPQRSISTTPSASPVVASPLPPVPKAKTLSSTKSANWVARLHAQPSNAAVQSVRRYTNDEAQPGVHASLDVPFMAGSSARGSLDGDGAVPGVDLLGLDDQAVQDQWQQPETLPQGLNQTSDQGIWDDNAQHSAAGELKPIAQHVTQVADQHWVGIAEQQDASELPLQIWPDDAQLLHSVQAADTRHSGRAEPSSLRQSVCKAAVQPVQDGQLMDPFSQFQASPSVSSLQAEPSMLSTSTDHHPTEVWHSAAASMMSSSTDNILQQLDDWHDADEFGNFESGAASNTHVVTEVLHQPQTAQEQSVLLQNAAVNSCMQEGCSLRQPSSDLEAWGSFTFPDSAVPLQLLSHDDTLHPESSLSASEGRDALRQSQGMLHMEPQHSSSNLQGHISIVEHLDAKQQKQLELFMSSADLSEISS